MRRLKRLSLVFLAQIGLLPFVSGQPVILNEIMYHPSSERVDEEYVELFNAASTNVNLAGWRLAGGVQFLFPSNATVASRDFLVVAASRSRFMAKYPGVTNAVGDWLGLLNNHDQEIRVLDASGEVIDSVRYADEGEWSTRQRSPTLVGQRGWEWFSPHDGFGKSLELIQPGMPNEHGQNWAASLPTNGTPGRANSVSATNVAPLILDVAHFPIVPRSTNPVSVTARVLDESALNVTVALHFRIDSATPPPFSVTNMLDDGAHGDGAAGDGLFGATLPAMANNAVVEFYVRAVDAQGRARTWPGPAIAAPDGAGPTGQVANALFQVDNSVTNQFGGQPSMQPVYKFIMTEAERAQLAAIPCSGSQNSDAQMNGTFISLDGTGAEARYLCGFRNRGHGSRCATPPNYRVNFRSDELWNGVRAINLNSVNAPVQHFASVLAIKSGAAGGRARAVQLRVNNAVRAPGSGGAYACLEEMNTDFADARWPLDGNGNIYRAIRDIAPPDFDYRGTNANAYRNTFFKGNNLSEDDWTDLIGMLNVMGLSGTVPFTTENARRVVNVEQWMTHLAVMNLFGNNETSPNIGYNDDYFMYRGVIDPRFVLLFHDLDSVLGVSSQAATADIFTATAANGMGQALNRFMHWPDFEPVYYATLQRLLDTTFSAAQFNALADQTLGAYASGTATTMKNWMNTRRAHVQGLINGRVPPATNAPLAAIAGEPRSPTPFTTATLTVSGSNVTHYRYRLNGGAWSAETPVAAPIALAGLANHSTNTVFVVGRNAAGIYQDFAKAAFSRTWVVRTSTPPVRLNEILARNDTAAPQPGGFPDLVELFNEGTTTVNLAGLRLSDDPAAPDKFTFPTNTLLAPGTFLTLVADDPDGSPGLHLGFSLNQDGEGVHLFDRATNGGTLLDSVTFGLQVPDHSLGRFGIGNGDWQLCQPTFGTANVPAALGGPAQLRLNEWLASGAGFFPDDFIELFNPAALPVALGGLYLTDNHIGAPFLHRVAPLSFIAGDGEVAFLAGNNPAGGARHLNFALAAEQGEIALVAPDGTPIDCVVYGPSRAGVAWGRCPNGSGAVGALGAPTPGLPNSCPVPPPPVQVTNLVRAADSWRFDESGSNLGTAWKEPGYNDSGWNSGPAALGRLQGGGSSPEPIRTQLSIGGNRITYYFRRSFTVPSNLPIASVTCSNLVDDGAVFYLNGVEFARFNMPTGAVTSSTVASTDINNAAWQSVSGAALTNLVPGTNLLAVEVHQRAANSQDVVFALRLDGMIATNSASQAGVVINEIAANNPPGNATGTTNSDWVELHNPSQSAVDLTGLSLTDDEAAPRRWVFPPGSILPARGYLLLACDPDLPASALNTGFGLDDSGDSLFLFDKPSAGGGVVDSIRFGIQIEEFTLGRFPNGGSNWVLCAPTYGLANLAATLGDPFALRLNEWMAAPESGDDWFELFNPGDLPVALGGLFLTDDLSTPESRQKHPIQPHSFLGAGTNAWQRFRADDPDEYQGADHVGFKLYAGGEALGLYASAGAPIDEIAFGPQAQGVSQGRLPDGGDTVLFFPGTASPGRANHVPLTDVVINEVLTHTDLPLEDAIELHNPTSATLNIGGWWLSDEADVPRKFQIPAGTLLPPGGFAVFYEMQFNDDLGGGVPFSLNGARGDEVILSATTMSGAFTGHRGAVTFGPAANGVSFGRHRTSTGVDFTAMSALTLGTAVTPASPTNQLGLFRTGQGASNVAPRVGPVVLHQIMYHPPDVVTPGATNDNVVEEFIELHNRSAMPVPLFSSAQPTNTWRLRNAVDFDFPMNTSIPGRGHLAVVSFNPATNLAALTQFQARYGSNLALVGPYAGKLDNSGENVELLQPDTPQPPGSPDAGFVPYVLVDRVRYADRAPWPVAADGLGAALHRINVFAYGNDPANWGAAPPVLRPGERDTDGDTLPDSWEINHGLNRTSAADADLDLDGDGISNLGEHRAGTDPTSAASVLRLQAARLGGSVELRFTAVSGRAYTMWRCYNLPPAGTWTKWVSYSTQTVTSVKVLTDGPVNSDSRRFYRVSTP